MEFPKIASREEWLAARLALLANGADTTLALVSRAPFDRIEQFRKRMGWTLPWYSSYGSDFNYDFHVSSDEAIVDHGVMAGTMIWMIASMPMDAAAGTRRR
jgi:predicted dithiol-disulfide oxidoreductase (DUF899 family)